MGIQIPEKYKENFDISSEGALHLKVRGFWDDLPPALFFSTTDIFGV
jgi:hypothetical protein